MKGIIFDIQKFSLSDGRGIRTTVFFKGCPLRCTWCSNPESQNFGLQRIYWKKRCIGCGNCVKVCPKKEGCRLPGYIVCEDNCRKCIEACPAAALKDTARAYSVEELAEVIRQDARFYYRSGGGVTFSGGEALAQWRFVGAAGRYIKSMMVHIAVETCGYAEWPHIQEAVEYIDQVLFDIKHIDSKIHRTYTGQGNELILDNLRKLSASGKEVIIRIPVIKNVNDGKEHMEQVLALARENNIREIHLLPYHTLGKPKFEGLGYADYPLFVRPTDEELSRLTEQISKRGIKALVGG